MDCIAVYHPGSSLEISFVLEIICIKANGSTEETVDLLLTNTSNQPLDWVYILYPGDLFGPPQWLRKLGKELKAETLSVEGKARWLNTWVEGRGWKKNFRGVSGAEETQILFSLRPEDRNRAEGIAKKLIASDKTPYQNRTLELRDKSLPSNAHYRAQPFSVMTVDEENYFTTITLRHPSLQDTSITYSGLVLPVRVGVAPDLSSEMIKILSASHYSLLQCFFQEGSLGPQDSRWIRVTFRPRKAKFDWSVRHIFLQTRKTYTGEIVAPCAVMNHFESAINQSQHESRSPAAIGLEQRFIVGGLRKLGTLTRIKDFRIVILPYRKFHFSTQPPIEALRTARLLPFEEEHVEWNTGYLVYPNRDPLAVIEKIYKFLRSSGANRESPKSKSEITSSIGVEHDYACRILDWLFEKDFLKSTDEYRNYLYINEEKLSQPTLAECIELFKNRSLDFSVQFTSVSDTILHLIAVFGGLCGFIVLLVTLLASLLKLISKLIN